MPGKGSEDGAWDCERAAGPWRRSRCKRPGACQERRAPRWVPDDTHQKSLPPPSVCVGRGAEGERDCERVAGPRGRPRRKRPFVASGKAALAVRPTTPTRKAVGAAFFNKRACCRVPGRGSEDGERDCERAAGPRRAPSAGPAFGTAPPDAHSSMRASRHCECRGGRSRPPNPSPAHDSRRVC